MDKWMYMADYVRMYPFRFGDDWAVYLRFSTHVHATKPCAANNMLQATTDNPIASQIFLPVYAIYSLGGTSATGAFMLTRQQVLGVKE
jgi:hypothetical protein